MLFSCNGCSDCIICLSATKSHCDGGANPVSDSLIPLSELTSLVNLAISSSNCLIGAAYGPRLLVLVQKMLNI